MQKHFIILCLLFLYLVSIFYLASIFIKSALKFPVINTEISLPFKSQLIYETILKFRAGRQFQKFNALYRSFNLVTLILI